MVYVEGLPRVQEAIRRRCIGQTGAERDKCTTFKEWRWRLAKGVHAHTYRHFAGFCMSAGKPELEHLCEKKVFVGMSDQLVLTFELHGVPFVLLICVPQFPVLFLQMCDVFVQIPCLFPPRIFYLFQLLQTNNWQIKNKLTPKQRAIPLCFVPKKCVWPHTSVSLQRKFSTSHRSQT